MRSAYSALLEAKRLIESGVVEIKPYAPGLLRALLKPHIFEDRDDCESDSPESKLVSEQFNQLSKQHTGIKKQN